jgi:hypothetical protein
MRHQPLSLPEVPMTETTTATQQAPTAPPTAMKPASKDMPATPAEGLAGAEYHLHRIAA